MLKTVHFLLHKQYPATMYWSFALCQPLNGDCRIYPGWVICNEGQQVTWGSSCQIAELCKNFKKIVEVLVCACMKSNIVFPYFCIFLICFNTPIFILNIVWNFRGGQTYQRNSYAVGLLEQLRYKHIIQTWLYFPDFVDYNCGFFVVVWQSIFSFYFLYFYWNKV